MQREPGHILVQPDQQRPALSERGIVVRPVGRAEASGVRLAHAILLTACIRVVNPLHLDFCNNAHEYHQKYAGRTITDLKQRLIEINSQKRPILYFNNTSTVLSN